MNFKSCVGRWEQLADECSARDKSLSQGPNDIRCAAAQLQVDRTGHRAVGAQELEHSHTVW
jgi:hypothetical protein